MPSLTLTFTGKIPAKRTSVVMMRLGGKRPSKAYARWEAAELASLADAPRIYGPVAIDYDFWVGGKDVPATFDLDNAIASINDLLQKAQLISGDDWATLPQPCPRLRGFIRGEQRTVVTIASVEAPWVPILAVLCDNAALRSLAAANGLTLTAQRTKLWDELTSIEVAV